MNSRRQDGVEVSIGQVGRGHADLRGGPAALQRADDLARRAGIDPDERAENVEHMRVWVRLQGEPEPVAQAGAGERRVEPLGVLDEPSPVVDEQRRPPLAGE